MNRLPKIFYCITVILFLAIPSLFAQNKNAVKKKVTDYIKITDEAGKNIEFIFNSNAKFEIQNGVLNISVLAKNNSLFEITGISEKAIKDTLLNDASFKMMCIFSQNEKSLISNPINSKSILHIKCKKIKKGNPINIILTGKIFGGGKTLLIDAKLSGQIPEKRNTTTRKIN